MGRRAGASRDRGRREAAVFAHSGRCQRRLSGFAGLSRFRRRDRWRIAGAGEGWRRRLVQRFTAAAEPQEDRRENAARLSGRSFAPTIFLSDGAEDLRALPFAERRKRLEAFLQKHGNDRLDLSPLVEGGDWEAFAKQRAEAPAGVEGLMLKRWDSLYEAGRPKGPWFKWKRDPFTADCVLMYAQRGHGKRSSYYSDYTFGCWRNDELLPVGKAYFGFTDEELPAAR